MSGAWSSEPQQKALRNISYRFTTGRLYGIAGEVGSGKSSFFDAITQELPYVSGIVKVSGRIAYVEQDPVIFSDTIKNNIIFGHKYNKELYEKVKSSALLDFDIDKMP